MYIYIYIYIHIYIHIHTFVIIYDFFDCQGLMCRFVTCCKEKKILLCIPYFNVVITRLCVLIVTHSVYLYIVSFPLEMGV